MIDNLEHKRILFLCTEFYSYYKIIIEEFERMGAKVRFVMIPRFSESPRNLLHSKSYFFFYHYLRNPQYRTKWTNSLISEIKDEKYDVLFCLGDVPFKPFFLKWFKNNNPYSQTYLFLWDKLSIVYVPPRIISLFDFKFSFDRDDCSKVKGLQYLPDFYLHTENARNQNKIYDICAIATYTKDRGYIALELKKFCDEHMLSAFIYLLKPVRKKSRIERLLNLHASDSFLETYGHESFLKENRLSADEVDIIQNQSHCLFDFSYKGRQGLTLNGIAAIAQGKKLITSNYRIKEESFYNSNNIYIYDYENPKFDVDFINTPVVPLNMDYLRLDNWLRYILCR